MEIIGRIGLSKGLIDRATIRVSMREFQHL